MPSSHTLRPCIAALWFECYPVSHMRKLKLREVEWLAPNQPASKWQSEQGTPTRHVVSGTEWRGLRLRRGFRGPFIPEVANADYCRSKGVGWTGLWLKINFFFWKGSFSRRSNQLCSWHTFPNTLWAKQSQGQLPAVAAHGGGPWSESWKWQLEAI